MSINPVQARYEAFFESDFMPVIRNNEMQGAESRIAYAEEFTAFQLGQINRKLAILIDLMTARAVLPDTTTP